MTHGVQVNVLSNFRSLAVTVWERQCFEDIFTKDVCRTSPATPGLLNTGINLVSKIYFKLLLEKRFNILLKTGRFQTHPTHRVQAPLKDSLQAALKDKIWAFECTG